MIAIVTGGIGGGKTTAARDACERLAARGIPVLAFLSVAAERGEDGRALGYDLEILENVSGGKLAEAVRVPLAVRTRRDAPFNFSDTAFAQAIDYANTAFRRETPPSVIAVDEIGRLELEGRGGWNPLLDRCVAETGSTVILTTRTEAAASLIKRLEPIVPRVFLVEEKQNLDAFLSFSLTDGGIRV